MIRQPYHLVEYSPWPLMMGMNMLMLSVSMAYWFHSSVYLYTYISMALTMVVMCQWWRDTIRESTFLGCHNLNVMGGIKIGMVLFILSEVMFFMAFFWSYFHSSLSPVAEIGMVWPPMGILIINPMFMPLLNTIILLSSGATITFSHYSLLHNKKNEMLKMLMITILLGIYFSILQLIEYKDVSFSFSDSVYGSTFYIATGFHGMHVIIGTIFLVISFIRQKCYTFKYNHHIGFEMAVWYWHFVDVVWIFLFISIYWWGS
uniref:Cytochrome c oxidase subunit 3 n=1 Tax=Endomyzostoma sp. MZ-2009 TaxID=644517 RepID=C7BG52_9ANNE|nr:cytochrome c oxidase subunit III [Endomyzostoma sp. MZ-2009]